LTADSIPVKVVGRADVGVPYARLVLAAYLMYLALVITAFGYLAWNWALRRVEAPRAAIFLNVQPVVGALLGVALLGEPLTAFTLAGGALIVAGLGVTFGNAER